jgi:hypothetical protein
VKPKVHRSDCDCESDDGAQQSEFSNAIVR